MILHLFISYQISFNAGIAITAGQFWGFRPAVANDMLPMYYR